MRDYFLQTAQGKIDLPYTASTQHFSPNVQRAIQFCNEWLHGQSTWTVHTSGSTGTPQPITLQREQLVASAMATLTALQLQPQQNALVALNTAYIAGLMMLVRGLVGNLNLYVVEPAANPLQALPPHFHIDFVALVPLQIQQIIQDQNTERLQTAQAIILGGAALSAELELQIQQHIKAPCYHTYGMTETVSHVALRRVNGATATAHYTALPHTFFTTDARGCLCIHTPICPEVVVTNDVVTLLNPTQFLWHGRADHIINSGGVKIPAEQVEQAIAQHLASQKIPHTDFFIAGMPHPIWGEQVGLIWEKQRLNDAAFLALQQAVATQLGRFFVPKQQYVVENFIRTATQKINRKETIKILFSD